MKRNNALQGLRSIAFLLVFFSHCNGFIPVSSGGHGAIGVEIFFVLSGFLMEIRAREEIPNGFRYAISYTFRKIKKFYWLHILTMILALIPYALGWILNGAIERDAVALLPKIATNLLLVQSWVPNREHYFALNGVTWYLSTSILTYILFPAIHRLVSKIKTAGQGWVTMLIVYIVQLVLATIFKSNEYMHAIVYIHPLTRCLDFLAGMVLGVIHKSSYDQYHAKGVWTLYEVLALASLGAAIALFNRLPEAYSYVTLSAPAAWVLVLTFSHESGNIAKVMSRKIVTFLGDISFELFMIHLLVIRYWSYMQWIVRRLSGQEIPGVVSTLGALIVSIVAAIILRKIGNYIGSGLLRVRHVHAKHSSIQ